MHQQVTWAGNLVVWVCVCVCVCVTRLADDHWTTVTLRE